jgi:hypothetical protein
MSLYTRTDASFTMHRIDIASATDQQLLEISNEQGLGLSLVEMKQIQAHYQAQKRSATDAKSKLKVAKKLTASSKPISLKPPKKLTLNGASAFSKTTQAS